jgi:hypothetical protein
MNVFTKNFAIVNTSLLPTKELITTVKRFKVKALGREHYKGKYHCTVDLLFDWFGICCMTIDNFHFYLQNRLIQSDQTGGQWYSDTSPLVLPALGPRTKIINIMVTSRGFSTAKGFAHQS